MKNTISFHLIVLFLALAGCKKDEKITEPVTKDCYTASKGFCGYMCFNKNYGNGYEEGLLNLKNDKLDKSQLDSLVIETQLLQGVKDYHDNLMMKDYYRITFINPKNGFKIHSVVDVLDELGDYYFINWCED